MLDWHGNNILIGFYFILMVPLTHSLGYKWHCKKKKKFKATSCRTSL